MVKDEKWQGVDEQGRMTGAVTRPQAAKGALHASSHVWIWRGKGDKLEILLQKRSKDKRTWPGFLDISAAGHVNYPETPLDAALRETQEEIGLDLSPDDLNVLFVHRAYIVSEKAPRTVENELCWVYGYEWTVESDMKFSDLEVDSVIWMDVEKFIDLARDELKGKHIVPHGAAYFEELLEQIDLRAELDGSK